MATTQKIRNDIAKTKEKIAEQQKRLRALEAQLAEEENLEIVRMVKAVKMDNLPSAGGEAVLPGWNRLAGAGRWPLSALPYSWCRSAQPDVQYSSCPCPVRG